MGKLKIKFPTSPLLVYANKIIEDSKSKIDKLPSRYKVSRDKASTSPSVKYYYIPGVGDIPQKLSIDTDEEALAELLAWRDRQVPDTEKP